MLNKVSVYLIFKEIEIMIGSRKIHLTGDPTMMDSLSYIDFQVIRDFIQPFAYEARPPRIIVTVKCDILSYFKGKPITQGIEFHYNDYRKFYATFALCMLGVKELLHEGRAMLKLADDEILTTEQLIALSYYDEEEVVEVIKAKKRQSMRPHLDTLFFTQHTKGHAFNFLRIQLGGIDRASHPFNATPNTMLD